MPDRYEARELSVRECWDLVDRTVIGRIAFVLDGRPRVFPVNIVRDGSTVVFRTSADSELGATRDADVALEADGFDAARREAWSVIVSGRSRAVTDPEELDEINGLALFPWHTAPKALYVRVEPELVSGRRFVAPYAGPEGFDR
jgi:nitroimidazol reductase NimA-like FMN-containing flavoprotein (pyridoxamine 5'-phosphate oxidase superfamily)